MASSKTIREECKPELTVTDGTLMITLEDVKDCKGRPSASGKSRVLASTRGNVYIAELDCHVGLNVYRK